MAQQSDVTLPGARGRQLPAFFALPDDVAAPRPALLVIHEILGLNDDIRRIAARFADAGYAALAPDLFAGRGIMPFCVIRTVREFFAGGGAPAEDLLAARDWLAKRQEVDEDRIGVVGFCMGGGFALLVARRAPFAVAAPFYGEVPQREDDLRDICPVVGGYGGRDKLFAEHGRRLERHLQALGVPHDVHVYPDAGHSYMSPRGAALLLRLGAFTPLRAEYNEAAAEDSWRRMFAFFAEHLDPERASL